MRIDCHVHTYRSGDCRVPVARMLDAASEAGIDVVCITDHGTIDGALEAAELVASQPELEASKPGAVRPYPAVIAGQECRTWAGEIIGLFLQTRIPGNLQPRDVVAEIESQGGLVYVPHPFCPDHNGLRGDVLEDLVDEGLVDIIEVHNAKVAAASNRRAEAFAADHSLVGVAASDAHYPEFVGRAYVEVASSEVSRISQDPGAFLEALACGRLHRGVYDYAEADWPKRV